MAPEWKTQLCSDAVTPAPPEGRTPVHQSDMLMPTPPGRLDTSRLEIFGHSSSRKQTQSTTAEPSPPIRTSFDILLEISICPATDRAREEQAEGHKINKAAKRSTRRLQGQDADVIPSRQNAFNRQKGTQAAKST